MQGQPLIRMVDAGLAEEGFELIHDMIVAERGGLERCVPVDAECGPWVRIM